VQYRAHRAALDHGDRFEARVFTETERAHANTRPFTRAGTLAKRFAAKEACAKALGTGLPRACS
jgi:holo-[acyl-carrier protein] synthase